MITSMPDKKLESHALAALFPMIVGAEYSALVDDVEAHGVREPLILFEGKILDGRNRYMAAQETGKPFDVRVFTGTETEARALVLSLNLHRRHLTGEQKRVVVESLLRNDPSESDRAVAAKAKVSDKTVASVREKLEATAEIPQSTVRKGKDGRSTAAARPKVPSGTGKAIDDYNRKKKAEKAAKAEERLAAADTALKDFVADADKHVQTLRVFADLCAQATTPEQRGFLAETVRVLLLTVGAVEHTNEKAVATLGVGSATAEIPQSTATSPVPEPTTAEVLASANPDNPFVVGLARKKAADAQKRAAKKAAKTEAKTEEFDVAAHYEKLGKELAAKKAAKTEAKA